MKHFISDLHLFHRPEFCWGPRGFSSVEEMNEAIVSNWNSVVADDDEVYVLGDCILNDNEGGIELLKQLKGHIYIIAGNHDTDARIELYKQLDNVEYLGFAHRLKYKKYHFFLCHYPVLCDNYDDTESLKTKMICLCGHTHTKDPFIDMKKGLGIIYHVDADAHNCTPVSIEQIIQDIKEFRNGGEQTNG